MKCIFTVASLAPEFGGPARSVPSLCSALANRGAGVSLLSLSPRSAQSRPLLPSAQSVNTQLVSCNSSLHLPGLWTFRFERALERLVVTGDCVLYDSGVWLPTNHIAARVARKRRIPRIVSPRGMLSKWALDFKSLKKKIAWRLYQHRDLLAAQAFHVTSTDECAEVRDLGFRQPIAVIPNGVDLPLNAHTSSTPSTRTVLFLSRIHPKKGLRHLVEAWASIQPAGWKVIIAGPDENGHQQEIVELVRCHGLVDQFHFIGPVNDRDKWNVYRDADLFVLPTFSENFGLVVAEALAAGVPVITTKGTPWQELPAHRCGWWIDLSTENLAAALCDAVRLPDAARREMGLRGRKLIEQKYSWASVGEQMESFFRWLLHGGAKPSCVLD